MIKESGKVTLFLEARVLKVKTEKNRVVSAVIESGGEKTTVTAKVFIDATETGDFIPLTGARYRVGNSIAPKIDKESVIQDITYVAVVKKYPDGLPPELKLTKRPPRIRRLSAPFPQGDNKRRRLVARRVSLQRAGA